MSPPSLDFLQTAVVLLGILALGTSAGVYLFMEIHFRRQLYRQARKVILASALPPALDAEFVSALWSASGPRDREILEEILVDLCRSPDALSARQASATLSALGIHSRWIEELRAGNLSRRVLAATKLGYVHDLRGVNALVAAAADPSPQVELAVTLSLGRLKDTRGLEALFRVAQNSARTVPDLTLAAALAACAEGQPALLVPLLKAPQANARIVAAWALSEVADLLVLRDVLRAAGDAEPEVRAKAARALGRIPTKESLEALELLTRDRVWFVRVRALDALGKLGDAAGVAAALYALGDNVREVRYRAASALRQMRVTKGEVVAPVLANGPRRSLNSLISEWDRAGFLWDIAAGLSTRNWERFGESRQLVKALVAAGITRALVSFVLVFPDIKVRLRLLRLLLESPHRTVRDQVAAVARLPECDARVAARIRKAFPPADKSLAGVSAPNAQ